MSQAAALAALSAKGGSASSSGQSITAQIPTYAYGFSGPGVLLLFVGGLLSFTIFFAITITVLRALNPTFLRDVCTPGPNPQCTSISIGRSIWISAIIALIPTLIVLAIIYTINARFVKSAAIVVEGAYRSGLI
jgi:hypothetical protein